MDLQRLIEDTIRETVRATVESAVRQRLAADKPPERRRWAGSGTRERIRLFLQGLPESAWSSTLDVKRALRLRGTEGNQVASCALSQLFKRREIERRGPVEGEEIEGNGKYLYRWKAAAHE